MKPGKDSRKQVMPVLFACMVYFVSVWLIARHAGYDGSGSLPEDSYFQIDFIDVGEGDAILVCCDGKYMLIDGGGEDASRIIYSCLETRGISELEYVILSHPHRDHAGGLSAALNAAVVKHALSPVKEVLYDAETFDDFVKYVNRQNLELEIPKPGMTYSLGAASFTVLAPFEPEDPLSDADKANNNSLVLKIKYGAVSFLLMGDAEEAEEKSILLRYPARSLRSTVIKAGHHGSDTSSSPAFIRAVRPEYAVISVGKGNEYGLPDHHAMKNLVSTGAVLYRTDLHGSITFLSDGRQVIPRPDTENVGDVMAEPVAPRQAGREEENETAQTGEGYYILNINSMRFHYPDCEAVGRMREKNKRDFTGSRQELLDQGFKACGKCQP